MLLDAWINTYVGAILVGRFYWGTLVVCTHVAVVVPCKRCVPASQHTQQDRTPQATQGHRKTGIASIIKVWYWVFWFVYRGCCGLCTGGVLGCIQGLLWFVYSGWWGVHGITPTHVLSTLVSAHSPSHNIPLTQFPPQTTLPSHNIPLTQSPLTQKAPVVQVQHPLGSSHTPRQSSRGQQQTMIAQNSLTKSKHGKGRISGMHDGMKIRGGAHLFMYTHYCTLTHVHLIYTHSCTSHMHATPTLTHTHP